MSATNEVALSREEIEFLRLYHECHPRAQMIIRETASYLASTRLDRLRQEMLAAGMTQQADGTWKEPA